MQLKHIAFYLFCLLFASNTFASDKTSRVTLNMNTDWAFYRGDMPNGQAVNLDDSQWIPAVVPHVMQLEKKHCGGDGIYDGIGWYRRYFNMPAEYKNKRVTVSFEGVMTSCDVFMNGEKLTDHFGGYMGFVVDITDKINWNGNNVLAVRVSAEYDSLTPPGKPQDRMDFYYYSGIYRDVFMTVTDNLFITDVLEEDVVAGGGIFVTYPQVSKEQATVNVKTHVRNNYNAARKFELLTKLIDKSGKVVKQHNKAFNLSAKADSHIVQDIVVNNPQLWHPYNPNMYTLVSEVKVGGKIVDEIKTEIGIRTIKYTTEKGFFINGEWLYMRGTNRHQAYQNVGDAASNSMQVRDVIDMKRGGHNAVRAAHYPQDPAFLDACDKYGMLVDECIPGWQYCNTD